MHSCCTWLGEPFSIAAVRLRLWKAGLTDSMPAVCPSGQTQGTALAPGGLAAAWEFILDVQQQTFMEVMSQTRDWRRHARLGPPNSGPDLTAAVLHSAAAGGRPSAARIPSSRPHHPRTPALRHGPPPGLWHDQCW